MQNSRVLAPKIIVAHPGKQHSFHLATALKEKGMLYKYITTVYDKEDSLIMKLLKSILGKENRRRAANRKCSALEDRDVVLFETGFSLLLLLTIRLNKKKTIARWFNEVVSRHFQIKVAKYAIKHRVEMVICYDANCKYCFELLKRKAPNIIRVMDNAAPNRNYLNSIYTENKEQCGPFINTLSAYTYLFDKTVAKHYLDEIRLADYHIVASTFSRKALEYDGVPSDTIFVVPYGITSSRFRDVRHNYEEKKLNLIFIGEVNQRKGIYQICEAAKIIDNSAIRFNIVGSGYESQRLLFAQYKEWITIHGTAYFEKLMSLLGDNHVLLFPSMGDGFGFVILEAMAAGLPVIASSNSAAPDIIEDGVDGFIIPPCNTKALIHIIKWCFNNLDSLKEMGCKAREKAQKYTWDNYNRAIVFAVDQMIKNYA